MTCILICIWPNWYHLLAIAALSDAFQLICLIPKKKPQCLFFFFKKEKKKGINSSQLFFSPDFPENCKWTKREESWGAALTIKWLWQCRVCAQPGRAQTISLPMIAASSPICITVFHSKLCWTTKKLCLCILYLLCSNVCQTLFHVGLVLSGAVCTFHQQTKKVSILHAHRRKRSLFYIALVYVFLLRSGKRQYNTQNMMCNGSDDSYRLRVVVSYWPWFWSWYAFYIRCFLCGNHLRYKHVINTTQAAHTAIKEEQRN